MNKTKTENKATSASPVDALVRHPIQPLIYDGNTVRFKQNAIVTYLLDHGGIDMNDIGRKDFSQEDREQFAQLIGYSHSGAYDLSYMSDEVLSVAETIYVSRRDNKDQKDVMIAELKSRLEGLRETLADALSDLFEVHPDDLKDA